MLLKAKKAWARWRRRAYERGSPSATGIEETCDFCGFDESTLGRCLACGRCFCGDCMKAEMYHGFCKRRFCKRHRW